MEEKFRKSLEENGTDVETVLKRFLGNEAMYMKFLLKFIDDKNYDDVIESIEKRDYETAFETAHTLKGVAANLGIEHVYAASSRITELLRNKPGDQNVDAELDEYKEQLQEAYETIREVIEQNRP